MARHDNQLVTRYLENFDRSILALPKISREYFNGQQGVYSLYDGNSLRYVGLAKNLWVRLKQHLTDRLKDDWDAFSVYYMQNDQHLHAIEAILIRISEPKGNKRGARLLGSVDLGPDLHEEIKRSLDEKLWGYHRKRPESERVKLSHTRRPNGKNRGVVPKGKRESASAMFVEIFAAQAKARLTDEEIQAAVIKARGVDGFWRRLPYINYMRWAYNNGKLACGTPKERVKRYIMDKGGKHTESTARQVRSTAKLAPGCTKDFARKPAKVKAPAKAPAKRWVIEGGKRVEFLKAANKAR